MRKCVFPLVFFIFLFCSTPAFAHPGGTDAQGGHYDDGDYHFHHGYSAHYHEGGVCPYDFHDATSDRSISPATSHPSELVSGKSSSSYKAASASSIFKGLIEYENGFLIILVLCLGLLSLPALKEKIQDYFQEKAERKKEEALRKHYMELYAYRAPQEFCDIPPNVTFDEKGLPHQIVNGVDIFMVKYSYYGKCFHTVNCPSDTHIVRHYLAVQPLMAHRKPCPICGSFRPDAPWLDKYVEIRIIKKQYDIP